MKKILLIAEKPSVARELAGWIERNGAFGGGKAEKKQTHISIGSTTVTWVFGHILELNTPEQYDERYARWQLAHLPIIPNPFKLHPKADAEIQLRAIGAMLKSADEIIHAGDPDDEGQMLVSEVIDYFGCTKPVMRLWLSALDEASIGRAMNGLKPDSNYRGFYESALARSRADWLVGINLTRACTIMGRQRGAESPLSIGRVQTPTLALIVRREQEIRNFKPKDFYTPWIDLVANPAFRAKWSPAEGDERLDSQGYLTDRAKAALLVSALRDAGKAQVVDFSAEKKTESAPLPFSLSSLQSHLSAHYGHGAQETLEAAQSLYEKKLTSYPRTDCDFLPESQHGDARKVLANLSGVSPEIDRAIAGVQVQFKSRAWNDKKVTAHHAIIPLPRHGALPKLTHAEGIVYREVIKRYVLQFWPIAEYLETRIRLVCANEPFEVSGKVWTAPAWKAAFKEDQAEKDADETPDEAAQSLPVLKKGDVLTLKEAGFQSSRTKPPKRYTEGTLLTAMKNAHQLVTNEKLKKILKERTGIGTEATRAAILETLYKRNYIVKPAKKKELVPTPMGEKLIGVLPSSLTAPDMTAFWQQKMDEMRDGNGTHEPFIAEQEAWIRKLIPAVPDWFSNVILGNGKPRAEIEDTNFKCNSCNHPLRRVKGKFGWFFGCSNAECKKVFNEVDGLPVERPPITMSGHACPTCKKGKLSHREGKFGPYFHCEAKECGANFKNVEGKPEIVHTCPSCKKGRLYLRQGSKGPFWSCGRYKDGCKFSTNDDNGKPEKK